MNARARTHQTGQVRCISHIGTEYNILPRAHASLCGYILAEVVKSAAALCDRYSMHRTCTTLSFHLRCLPPRHKIEAANPKGCRRAPELDINNLPPPLQTYLLIRRDSEKTNVQPTEYRSWYLGSKRPSPDDRQYIPWGVKDRAASIANCV
jgi:hypothetical protein